MKCVHDSLQWRHNERDGVSNHQPHDCLLNRLFRHSSKKTSKLRVTGLCEGNSPVNSPHKGPVTRKMFPFDDVIMFNLASTAPRSGSNINRVCPSVLLYARRPTPLDNCRWESSWNILQSIFKFDMNTVVCRNPDVFTLLHILYIHKTNLRDTVPILGINSCGVIRHAFWRSISIFIFTFFLRIPSLCQKVDLVCAIALKIVLDIFKVERVILLRKNLGTHFKKFEHNDPTCYPWVNFHDMTLTFSMIEGLVVLDKFRILPNFQLFIFSDL